MGDFAVGSCLQGEKKKKKSLMFEVKVWVDDVGGDWWDGSYCMHCGRGF